MTLDNGALMDREDGVVRCGLSTEEGLAAASSRLAGDMVLRIALGDRLHISWGGVLSQKAGMTVADFDFEDFAILFVNRGTLHVRIDGAPVSVPKGHAVLVWPREECTGIEPNESDLVCQWVAFVLDQSGHRVVQQAVEVPRVAKVGNPTRMAELFRLLIDEYHAFQIKGERLRLLSSQASSFMLLSLLSRLSATDPEQPLASNALTVLVERAKDYIRANHTDQISAADVAKAMDCSTGYLRKAFRHVCGCSPSSYVLQRRLHKARTCLAETRMPISQVARECGFGSLSYFTRVFTRNEGVTPRDYRVTHSHSYVTPGI